MKFNIKSGGKGSFLIEQILNSSLSFAAITLIYAKGSDETVTQIALCTTFAYGASAVLKSRVITNLYLRNDISDIINQQFAVTRIRLQIFKFFFLCPVIPLLSYLTEQISFLFALHLSLLIYFLTCLDLIRNLLINCKRLKSAIFSAFFGVTNFFLLNLIFSTDDSYTRINFWIISLIFSFLSICTLEKKFIFQEIGKIPQDQKRLVTDSRHSTIESLLTTTTNVISYFLISQYLISFGANVQRTYIIFCALPMVLSLALTPYSNLLFRTKNVTASERLLQLLSLESMFLFFPLLVINTPIIEFFYPSVNQLDNFVVVAVVLSSVLNVFFFVYGVWVRTFWGFRKFLLVRASYLLVQNFLVLLCVQFLGVKSFFYVELLAMVFIIILWVKIEKSIRRSEM